MSGRVLLSLADQVADQVRKGMIEGRWRETLPGRDSLAAELGCSHGTVERVLRRLCREGLLVSQGPGRPRRIVLPEKSGSRRTFKITVLCYESSDRLGHPLLHRLANRLDHDGHQVDFAPKSLWELGMDVERVARFVESVETDAWVVVAGSREILAWFAGHTTPAFALFGITAQARIACAGPSKGEALMRLVDRLHGLGHRRIVMLVRGERRKPVPGMLERMFLGKLEDMGIRTSTYNLPDWEHGSEGLLKVLDSLFQLTPPTALIFDEAELMFAAIHHLSRRRISAPGEVSLACMDEHPAFAWFHPGVAHMAWDNNAMIRRVANWAARVSQGAKDRRKTIIAAKLVEGGTIGPAP